MRKKLKSEAGVTLVEMLASVMILVLLSLAVGTGMQTAMHAYQTVVAQSEVELLLSTAVDAIADDLRYAWDVEASDGSEDWTDFTYSSDSYGDKVRLGLVDDRIMARSGDSALQNVLSGGKDSAGGGAYGNDKAYKNYKIIQVADGEGNTKKLVTYDSATGVFTIQMMVTAENGISAGTPDGGVQVRCLNPMTSPTGGSS